jgi:rhodanese-related sulfurtransferase
MGFTSDDIRANRQFFAAKLRAEKQKADVLKKAKGEPHQEFFLLDARPRDGFAKAHIRGALCVPLEELSTLIDQLPKDKELVTYCWNQH